MAKILVGVKLWQVLGLLALVAVVNVCGEVNVNMQFYIGGTCGGAVQGSDSWVNGTSCHVLASGQYADYYCDENGTPYGSTCQNSCPSTIDCFPFTAQGQTWGQSYCINYVGMASGLITCTQTFPPDVPAEPVEVPPTAAVSPDMPAPAWTFPSDLYGSGTVSIQPYVGTDCSGTYGAPLDLTSDIRLCQVKNIPGFGNLYLRADCFVTNSSSYAWFCGADATCSNCQPFPSTPSGQCLNYDFSLLKSVSFTCPSQTPTTPPTITPTPSGDGSSLSFVYATFFIILGVAYLLI